MTKDLILMKNLRMTMKKNKIVESLQPGDLEGRVDPIIHIDEYIPKMGESDEIIVISFKVQGKTAAIDLENFIEKGYDWILDTDTSPGEISSGDYLVFVEAERRTTFPAFMVELLDDLKNLTEHSLEDWKVMYYVSTKNEKYFSATIEEIETGMPLSPRSFRELEDSNKILESMMRSSHAPMTHYSSKLLPRQKGRHVFRL